MAPESEEPTRQGLIPVWPPEDSAIETQLDIIAIHGLGGHPFKTWEAGNTKLWIRDFLPSSIPEARIFTFGYDSGIAFDRSASRIDDFSRDLLERLRNVRRNSSVDRPVIFICHSLGGIVFKKALIIAHERDSRYGALLKAIRGVIFLGTPHRGADIAYWSSLVGKLAKFPLMGNIRTNLLDDLKPKSQVLGDICSQFVERSKPPLQIFTFYERVKMQVINDLVVDADSAILHLPNETPLPLETDHSGLCKFLTSSNSAYEAVLNSILDLADEAKKGEADFIWTAAQKSAVASLVDFDPFADINEIAKPHKNTCTWILNDSRFRSWAQGSQSFLWIQGSPGSGKSTLSRYVLTQLENSTMKLATTEGKGQATIKSLISMVVCGGKNKREISSSYVLCSVLFQFLVKEPKLFRSVEKEMAEFDFSKFSAKNALLCLSLMLLHARGLKLWIIIDALDEVPSKAASEVLEFLSDLVQNDSNARLKIFITSRNRLSLHTISSDTMLCQNIHLDINEVHKDVSLYIGSVCDDFCRHHNFPAELGQKLRSRVVDRCGGLFLQASLLWSTFCEGVSSWKKSVVESRLKELDKLPRDLQALYCHLLSKVPEDLRGDIRDIFSWMLVAREPLRVVDLNAIVSIQPSHASFKDLASDMHFNFEEVLRSWIGLFVQINSRKEVHFRHQSVRDILMTPSNVLNGEILQEFRRSTPACHYLVTRTCFNLLGLRDITHYEKELNVRVQNMDRSEIKRIGFDQASQIVFETTLSTAPLALYTAKHWAVHFQETQEELEICSSAVDFFLSNNLFTFRLMRSPWTLEERRIKLGVEPKFFSPDTGPLHALVQMGDFVETFKLLVKEGQDPNSLDEQDFSPLHWALLRGRKRIAHYLLQSSTVNPNLGKEKPIHVCLEKGVNAIELFKFLVCRKNVDVNVKDPRGKTALHKIAERANFFQEHIDSLLARTDLLVNERDNEGIVPLIAALSNGYGQPAAISLLKLPNARVDISFKDKNGSSALSLACVRGWLEVRKILQRLDSSQMYSFDDDGMNPLTRAAFFGLRRELEGLLDGAAVADVHRAGSGGRFNLMNLCAQQDWGDLVELLLTKFGLKKYDQDTDGRTILHWAALSGWNYMYTSFMTENRNIINTQDFDGCTALHLAAVERNLQGCKFLLKQGANPLIKDKHGRNAVLTAAMVGSKSILEFFLESPLREFGRDSEGCTLLHLIATWEWPETLETYIRNKRPIIDVVNQKRQTPLHLATIFGNSAMIKILIKRGADIRRRDCVGSMPIHYAVREDSVEVARLLVDCGADLQARDGFKRSTLQLAIRSSTSSLPTWVLVKGGDVANRDKWGRNALHYAARLRKFSVAQSLLYNGVAWQEMDLSGFTPFHTAVFSSHLPTIRVMIRHFPQCPRILDGQGNTPLDYAKVLEEHDIATELRDWGMQHSRDYETRLRKFRGNTRPLISNEWHEEWEVSIHDHLKLERGLHSPYLQTATHDYYSIHGAAKKDDFRAVSVYLSKESADTLDEYNWTPLHIAALKGNTGTVRVLVEEGRCTLDLRTPACKEFVNITKEAPGGVKQRPRICVSFEDDGYLVRQQTQRSFQSPYFMTAFLLTNSVRYPYRTIYVPLGTAPTSILSLQRQVGLKEKSKPISEHFKTRDYKSQLEGDCTAIRLAAQNNNISTVEYLLSKGASLSFIEDLFETGCYARRDAFDLVRKLLDKDPEALAKLCDATNADRGDAVFIPIVLNDNDLLLEDFMSRGIQPWDKNRLLFYCTGSRILEALVKIGADPRSTITSRKTLLHVSDSADIIEYLLGNFPDLLEARDANDLTPLMDAVDVTDFEEYRRTDFKVLKACSKIRALLESGADHRATIKLSRNGLMTALDMAVENRFTWAIEILQNWRGKSGVRNSRG